MRIVLQRVKEASVTIDGEVHGAINKGYMILVGFNNDDTHEIIDRLVEKVIHLRVFEDENQKMNRSLIDVEGSILSISQFTNFKYTSLNYFTNCLCKLLKSRIF